MSQKNNWTRVILALAIATVSVSGCVAPTAISKQAGTPRRSLGPTAPNRPPTSLAAPSPSGLARSSPIAQMPGLEQLLVACHSIPNQSVQQVAETTRLFLNLPKEIYPDKLHNLRFTTVEGNATAGWISNAGLPGEAFEATPACWSYYYEFDGNGEVDLRVSSALSAYPGYFVRFLVRSR